MKPVDLRSDTVTKPTPAMLDAMMHAEVGDDVYGEDPAVNRLQKRVAELLGHESALFVPSGTMGNEICIKAHTQPGDEIIVGEDSHIVVYETAAPALLSGVQMKTMANRKGMIPLEDLVKAIRPSAYYMPRTTLICLENTHMRSCGSVVPLDYIKEVRLFALRSRLKTHLDGARLWNAVVASGTPPDRYGEQFDSVSVCFSKGLGAPVGSAIAGSAEFIEKCRKYRKVFGGGMRQAGYLAAAAHYALDHHVERLSEDHKKASWFAGRLSSNPRVKVDTSAVQTNMVIIDIAPTGHTQQDFLAHLAGRGVLMNPEGHSSIRAVMHMDVPMERVQEAAGILESALGG